MEKFRSLDRFRGVPAHRETAQHRQRPTALRRDRWRRQWRDRLYNFIWTWSRARLLQASYGMCCDKNRVPKRCPRVYSVRFVHKNCKYMLGHCLGIRYSAIELWELAMVSVNRESRPCVKMPCGLLLFTHTTEYNANKLQRVRRLHQEPPTG